MSLGLMIQQEGQLKLSLLPWELSAQGLFVSWHLWMSLPQSLQKIMSLIAVLQLRRGNSNNFSFFPLKHILCPIIRTVSTRRF